MVVSVDIGLDSALCGEVAIHGHVAVDDDLGGVNPDLPGLDCDAGAAHIDDDPGLSCSSCRGSRGGWFLSGPRCFSSRLPGLSH